MDYLRQERAKKITVKRQASSTNYSENRIILHQVDDMCTVGLEVVCGRCLSSTRTHRPMEWKRDRSFRALARTLGSGRMRQGTLSCVQPAFTNL
ncbi:hypothetical protein EVAR_5252_1 [Eumeta japonica]|uniref:Uncharacterized protein n=1 Tax=Eumeta variegata TaxID=151549 RepID=A0A4C1XMF2_EUMVA|nr:hypothetical protein EVAR_5252_1 [Eumeta japonica]